MHGRPIFFVLPGTITLIYDYDYDYDAISEVDRCQYRWVSSTNPRKSQMFWHLILITPQLNLLMCHNFKPIW